MSTLEIAILVGSVLLWAIVGYHFLTCPICRMAWERRRDRVASEPRSPLPTDAEMYEREQAKAARWGLSWLLSEPPRWASRSLMVAVTALFIVILLMKIAGIPL